jgi:hypothetical protein
MNNDPRAQRLDLPTIATRLRELESLAARLTVSHRDPERFFHDRSDLKAGIGAVAKQLEGKHFQDRHLQDRHLQDKQRQAGAPPQGTR